MRGIVFASFFLTALAAPSASLAQTVPFNCGSPGPVATEDRAKFVSWNIQELAADKQIYDRPLRTAEEFATLREYRNCLQGDVFALQEVASPKAVAQVFPTDDYDICFSGQKNADELGLAPAYDPAAIEGIRPDCFSKGDVLPGEVTDRAFQYVALTVRRGSGIAIVEMRDVPAISQINPEDGRQTRWGLEAVVERNGLRLRLLIVHLKSGCAAGPITDDLGQDEDCPGLAKQLPHLKAWIDKAAAETEPFMIIGDFNRRLDLEDPVVLPTDMMDVLNGATTTSTSDDLALSHTPTAKEFKCWPDDFPSQRFSIDFFVADAKAGALLLKDSDWKWCYQHDIDLGTPKPQRPSDHCPIQVLVAIN
jgi:endonuclease/exonuclease/phosphatase family metal-dependent hydrolase